MPTVGLLCGGLSTRMGRKKELQRFRGRPLIELIAECLSKMGYNVYLLASSRDAQAISSATGGKFPVLVDSYEARTPLNGLRTLLGAVDGCAFLLGGDSPIINNQLIDDALALCDRGFAAVLPLWRGGRVDTVHAAYSSSLLELLDARLLQEGADLSMANFLRDVNPVAFMEAERYGLALGDADTALELTLLEHLYNGRGCMIARGRI
ncbi:molybdenum cofactor guanylyltransferase [Conexivisphaera calida]|uniref:MobA-like NTP transferase domain-containing protein n=1 Tax=Conexivisphaera calida TaxID=1874277 RepID=A0A4P2VJE7_9ARCH|nr:NTP transferase domain-containing protein [Conexivisphaera calida]BBE41448.1 hypothetical protein NAS2_0034 [Conexivisphaera calida]